MAKKLSKNSSCLVPILTYKRKKKFWTVFWEKYLVLKIGQNGYQNAKNFFLNPNLQMKLRKSAQRKIYLEKLAKGQFFLEWLFGWVFFFNFACWLGMSVKFCVFRYPYWPFLKKKSFQPFFLKNILIHSVVLSWWVRHSAYLGTCAEMLGRRGGAKFLLQCHAPCPICRTFLIHFSTHIYISILIGTVSRKIRGGQKWYQLIDLPLSCYRKKFHKFLFGRHLVFFYVKLPSVI